MDQHVWNIIATSFWPILKAGLTMTLPLAFLSFFFGLIIAVLAALVQYAKIPVVKKLVRIYVCGILRGNEFCSGDVVHCVTTSFSNGFPGLIKFTDFFSERFFFGSEYYGGGNVYDNPAFCR